MPLFKIPSIPKSVSTHFIYFFFSSKSFEVHEHCHPPSRGSPGRCWGSWGKEEVRVGEEETIGKRRGMDNVVKEGDRREEEEKEETLGG